MTKLDDLRKELKTLKAAAIEAIRDAQGNWTGWDFPEAFGPNGEFCIEGTEPLEEALEALDEEDPGSDDDDETAGNDNDDDEYEDDYIENPWKNRRLLEEALEQANAFAEEVEKDAKTASDYGDDAIADIENLDAYGARQDIDWASSKESKYGDCRTYRPAVEAVEAWAAVCEEVLKLRAIIHPA